MQPSRHWQTLAKRRLSRRRVLRTGVLGLGAAAMTLVDCGDGEEKTVTPGVGKVPAGDDSFLTPSNAKESPIYGGHGVTATRTIFGGLDLQSCVDCAYPAAWFHGYLFSIDRRTDTFDAQAARSYERIDELTHVWKLRQGIKFQNVDPLWGRELTAEDVAYSTTRRRDNPACLNDKQFLRDLTDHFEATDQYTFRLAMKAPFSPILDEFGDASYPIVAKEVVEKWGDLNQHSVGFGAYILKEFVRGERVKCVRNPDFYMEGLPYIDSRELLIIPDESTITKAFETGQTDAYGGSEPTRPKVDQWKTMEGIVIRTVPNYWHRTFMLKVDRPPFNDIRVRKAIDLSVDRQDIIDKMAFGYGKFAGPVVPDMVKYALPQEELREFYKVDIAQAKQLLSAAGFENGLDVELKAMNAADLSKLSQIVIQHLAKAGISVKLVLQELGIFLAQTMYASNFEMMCYYNLPFDHPDRPLLQWHSKGQAGISFSGYDNPEADEWIRKERAEFNPEKRRQLILDAQRFFINEHGPQISTATDTGYAAAWNWTHGGENLNRGLFLALGVHDWLTERHLP